MHLRALGGVKGGFFCLCSSLCEFCGFLDRFGPVYARWLCFGFSLVFRHLDILHRVKGGIEEPSGDEPWLNLSDE